MLDKFSSVAAPIIIFLPESAAVTFLIYTNAPSVPASPDAVKSLASQRIPPSSPEPCAPYTSNIFDLTAVTASESVADNDNAILNGPASVVAELAFAVNVNVGLITPILIYFKALLIYTTYCRFSTISIITRYYRYLLMYRYLPRIINIGVEYCHYYFYYPLPQENPIF